MDQDGGAVEGSMFVVRGAMPRQRFNKLKQRRGIAMRSDRTARNYHAGLCLAANLHWLTSAFSNTA